MLEELEAKFAESCIQHKAEMSKLKEELRINVTAADLKVTLESGFWPKNIYAREWLSKERWEKRLTKFNSSPDELNS